MQILSSQIGQYFAQIGQNWALVPTWAQFTGVKRSSPLRKDSRCPICQSVPHSPLVWCHLRGGSIYHPPIHYQRCFTHSHRQLVPGDSSHWHSCTRTLTRYMYSQITMSKHFEWHLRGNPLTFIWGVPTEDLKLWVAIFTDILVNILRFIIVSHL